MEASTSVVYIESNHMSQRKKTVIDILRDNPGFVSGEAMSATLGISRNAVHKHVKSLRARGYRILGVSRRGYRLEEEPSRLSMGHITDRTAGSSLRPLLPLLRRDRIDERRGQVPGQQRRPRGHRGDRRGADRGARPPRPPLDIAGRQGPALLGASAASPADERGPPAHPGGRLRGGRSHRVAGRGARQDQVAQRPLHRRPQGRRHPAGGRRRAGRGRLGRGRHRHQRQHRVQRAARGAAQDSDVAEDDRRSARGQERAARPPAARARRALRRGGRERLRARAQRLPPARLSAAARA